MRKFNIIFGIALMAVIFFANNSNLLAQNFHEVGLHDPSFAGNITTNTLKIYQNSSNSLKFEISESNFVKISIYDTKEILVRTYIYNNLTAGAYEINLAAGNFSKGTYTCVLISGTSQESSKLVIE